MKLFLLEAVINCSRRGSRQRQEAQSRKVGLGWSWLKGSGRGPLPPGIRPVGPPCAGDGCLKASSMAAGPPRPPRSGLSCGEGGSTGGGQGHRAGVGGGRWEGPSPMLTTGQHLSCCGPSPWGPWLCGHSPGWL